MNPSTFDTCDTFATYQAASKLWKEAMALLNRLGERAEAGDKKARRLEDVAWARYNRRVGKMNQAGDMHWGAL